jgi:hypothetical protein
VGKKCEPVCVLNGKGGVGIEGVKCEEGDMEMAGLRMWVMAMEERGNLEMGYSGTREWD